MQNKTTLVLPIHIIAILKTAYSSHFSQPSLCNYNFYKQRVLLLGQLSSIQPSY